MTRCFVQYLQLWLGDEGGPPVSVLQRRFRGQQEARANTVKRNISYVLELCNVGLER
jgi:hypothetical protein